jgi:hypothetical protein
MSVAFFGFRGCGGVLSMRLITAFPSPRSLFIVVLVWRPTLAVIVPLITHASEHSMTRGSKPPIAGQFSSARIFKRPPEEHPVYAVVGRVAAEWAELEHQLDWIIWNLSQTTPQMAACMTSQMIGHFPRFNAIIALLTQHAARQELIKLVMTESGKVSGLAESRARRVHDAWYVDMASGEPFQFRSVPRKELNFSFQPQILNDLNALIRQNTSRLPRYKFGRSKAASASPV